MEVSILIILRKRNCTLMQSTSRRIVGKNIIILKGDIKLLVAVHALSN